jgi:hypothetical protein
MPLGEGANLPRQLENLLPVYILTALVGFILQHFGPLMCILAGPHFGAHAKP